VIAAYCLVRKGLKEPAAAPTITTPLSIAFVWGRAGPAWE